MAVTRFVYDGDSPRDFPHLGRVLAPGDTVDADDNPDPAFFQPVLPPPGDVTPAAEPEAV
jgi:hypothetical protein